MPFPLKRKPSNQHLLDIYDAKIRPFVAQILAENGVGSYLSANLECLFRPPHESACLETLVILSEDENLDLWSMAADAVRFEFLQRGASEIDPHVQVEIRHPTRFYNDRSTVLPNDPELLMMLEGIRNQMLHTVNSLLPKAWTSIAYHLRANLLLNDPGRPTVIIFCKRGSSFNFDLVLSQILHLLDNTTLDIRVEILPGEIVSSRDGDPIFLRSLPEKPLNGASISIEDRGDGAGTLGGWVYLNIPGTPRPIKCALTCYHVVRPVDENVAQHTDANGVRPNDSRGHVNVVYPAAGDSIHTMKKLAAPELAQSFGELRSTLSNLLSKPPMGQVVLASGQRMQNTHRVDWALIETPETFTPNKPPPSSNLQPYQDPHDSIYSISPDFKARVFGHPKVGDWVVKQGRTRPITSGYVNGMRRNIYWHHLDIASDEWEVLSSPNGRFAAPGDSGSWVFNRHGEVLGVLFAIDPNLNNHDAGFFTPMHLIQDDVKELTGGFISLD